MLKHLHGKPPTDDDVKQFLLVHIPDIYIVAPGTLHYCKDPSINPEAPKEIRILMP
jgi:hypothetical protein